MKKILYKSVPYVLSIMCGVILFLISDYFIRNQDINGLVINIAASLLAIPIVFLVYNYTEYKTSSKVNKVLAKNLIFEINSFMLKLLTLLRHILSVRDPLNWESIQKMLNQYAKDLKAKLKITRSDVDALRADKEELNELVYKADKSLLTNEQILILSELVKAMSHVVNEQKYRANKAALSQHIEHVLSLIEDWFDTNDMDDLRSHEHFQAAIEQKAKSKSVK